MLQQHETVFLCPSYAFVGVLSETLSRTFPFFFILGLSNLGFNIITTSKFFFVTDFCTESKMFQILCVFFLIIRNSNITASCALGGQRFDKILGL